MPAPTEVIIDASVAAKWYLRDEEHVQQADRMLQDLKRGHLAVVVPQFRAYELGSIFSKAVAIRRISDEYARTSLERLLFLPREENDLPEPVAAFLAARRFNRTLIDCFYLTIAEERGCPFWTDDRKLARALAPRHPFVRWIGDYPDPATPAPA